MFEANDVMHSTQGVSLLSSTINHRNNRYKGLGEYMYKDNIRHGIALCCVRSIPKHTWINSNNVYIANKEIIE
jgi:hypothetical protein